MKFNDFIKYAEDMEQQDSFPEAIVASPIGLNLSDGWELKELPKDPIVASPMPESYRQMKLEHIREMERVLQISMKFGVLRMLPNGSDQSGELYGTHGNFSASGTTDMDF
jgi:hypothetical protein